MNKKEQKKISVLQLVLTVIFVSCLLISNIITSRQVLFPFDVTMTSAVFIFPVTYVLSDVFSEVYGYKWSRLTCYLGFAMNLFMAIIFSIVINVPAPSYFEDMQAFQIVLGNSPKILIASLSAFILGDLANDKVFKYFKDKHPDSHEGFGFRAILSSLCGELVDSLVFLPVVFFGQMPIQALVSMTLLQVFIKIGYELIILPITKIIVTKVSKYELTNS